MKQFFIRFLIAAIALYCSVFPCFGQRQTHQMLVAVSSGFLCSDVDANAYIAAAGLTTQTHKQAACQMAVDLKAANIWTKFHAVYPYIGGTAASHSFNLKNPAQYTIAWGGTVAATHTANGVDGAQQTYGDTGLNASTVLALDDVGLSVYLRETSSSSFYDIGCSNGTTSQHLGLNASNGLTSATARAWSSSGALNISSGITGALGLSTFVRRSSTDAEFYRNGVSVGSTAVARAGSRPNVNVSVMSAWSGSGGSGPGRQQAFAGIHTGLTTAEAAALYTIVQNEQTILSRQV